MTTTMDTHGVFIGPSSTRTLAALEVALQYLGAERASVRGDREQFRHVTRAGEMGLAEVIDEIRAILEGVEEPSLRR